MKNIIKVRETDVLILRWIGKTVLFFLANRYTEM
jgi:hypothetical protein